MDALLRIQHFPSNALSAKNHVFIFATDFERAYDRVGIRPVLCRLERCGIGPRVYNSYNLHNGVRRVRYFL